MNKNNLIDDIFFPFGKLLYAKLLYRKLRT